MAELRGTEDLATYRIRFHALHEPDPRDRLAASDLLGDDEAADLDRRLARLDRASSHGPWTLAVLGAIAARPAVRAADLAQSFGRETQPFKIDVRKLKNLGLTISLEVGYRLSPHGEAYLRHRGEALATGLLGERPALSVGRDEVQVDGQVVIPRLVGCAAADDAEESAGQAGPLKLYSPGVRSRGASVPSAGTTWMWLGRS